MKTSEVRDNATAVLNVWTPDTGIQMKEVTREQFQQAHDSLGQVVAAIDQKENELVALRNQRDDLTDTLNNHCVRVRAGVKSYFGDNSTEYELAGGTRASDRKKSGPKSAPKSDPAKPAPAS